MKSFIKKIFSESDTDHLMAENSMLRQRQFRQQEYIRQKTNQLLVLLGTLPLRPEDFDDEALLEEDPIGTVTESFAQILEHEKVLRDDLQVAHDEIQAILASVGIGILVLDSAMRIQMYNQKVLEQFSLDGASLQGQTCCQAVCGSPVMPANCAFEKILDTRRPIRLDDWVRAGRHFEVAGTPIKNRFGDVTHVVLAYTDITSRVEAVRELRQREKIYRDLFDSVDDIVQCVTADGAFLFVNQAWRELLGYSPDETSGLRFWNIITPDRRSRILELMEGLQRGKRRETLDLVLFSKDGREIAVAGSVRSCHVGGKSPALLFMLHNAEEAAKGVVEG